jgi:uncharacterized protein
MNKMRAGNMIGGLALALVTALLLGGGQQGGALALTASDAPAKVTAPDSSMAAAKPAALVAGTNRVQFAVGAEALVGTLRLPADWQPGRRLPVIVVAGSWTTVKEQMADTYAARLTAAGLASLTFDYRNWGQSGGATRFFEDPASKILDLQAAARFAQGLPMAAEGQVGMLAICASAGYAAHAINAGAPVASLVTVAAWIHDPATAEPIYGGKEGVQQRIAQARAAVAAQRAGGPVVTVPACSATDAAAAMFGPFDYYLNPQRGAIAAWSNQFAVMSWEPWLTFDALSAAKALKTPTLFVHGNGCALPDNVRAVAAAMGPLATTLWMDGMHLDFYDQPSLVEFASATAVAHFRRTLATKPAAGLAPPGPAPSTPASTPAGSAAPR